MEKFNPKLYEVLGRLGQDATQAEIKAAYRSFAKVYHPDKYDGDPAYAEEMMIRLNEAYEILSNKEKRQEYNRKLDEYNQKIRLAEQMKKRKQQREAKPSNRASNNSGLGLVGVGLAILAFGLIIDSFSDKK